MNVVTSAAPRLPSCFGVDWDKNEPECAGGPHPTRRNPKTGTHVLERCDFYTSCGAKVAAAKNANGTLIPAQQLVRPPVVTPPPVQPPQQPVPQSPASPQSFQQWIAAQAARAPVPHPGTPTATMPQPPPQHAPQPVPHYIPAGAVQPATNWQLNYSSPPFLSTPEVQHPGEKIWAVLFRELLRATFKGMAQAAAHFFDTRVLKAPPEK